MKDEMISLEYDFHPLIGETFEIWRANYLMSFGGVQLHKNVRKPRILTLLRVQNG